MVVLQATAHSCECKLTIIGGCSQLMAAKVPYETYPSNMPIFVPRTKLANYMEYYAELQELVVWTSTSLIPNTAKYDGSTGSWTVKVLRYGKELVLHPYHLVMATGLADKPKIPSFEGMDTFGGQIVHTKYHKNANAWGGKKVVIIGAVSLSY
jgi:putative flavoprotein involved in K+ transport